MKITKTKQESLNSQLFKIYARSTAAVGKIEELLDAGADIDALDVDGESILIKMSNACNLAAVEFLMDRGANLLIADKDGWTALHFAAHNGHKLVLECLLKNNPKEQLLLKDKLGGSALHLAASKGHTSAVEFLLNHNSTEQLLLKDKDVWTALNSAATLGRASVIEVFLKHLPIAQHIEIYHEALAIAKEMESYDCIAIIEQSLLKHSLNEASPIDISQLITSPLVKIRNRL